jgi:hypothetical protein
MAQVLQFDPIFQKIEQHRAAYAAASATYAAENLVDEPPEPWPGRRSGLATAIDAAINTAHDKMFEAQIELASTEPRTLAGVAAVIHYVRESVEGDPDYEIVSDDYGDPRLKVKSWLETIERAIVRLAAARRT